MSDLQVRLAALSITHQKTSIDERVRNYVLSGHQRGSVKSPSGRLAAWIEGNQLQKERKDDLSIALPSHLFQDPIGLRRIAPTTVPSAS